jgi:pyruvate kinase
MRRAKIVATIGPASQSVDKLKALALAGLNVARINTSHGDHPSHAKVIAGVRRIAIELQKPISAMLDLSGPMKLHRVGT